MKALAEFIKANPKESLFLMLLGAVASWVVVITMDVWDTHTEVARLDERTAKIEDNYDDINRMDVRLRAVEIELARAVGRGE